MKHNHPNERCLAERKGITVYYTVQISVNYELRKKGSEKKHPQYLSFQGATLLLNISKWLPIPQK